MAFKSWKPGTPIFLKSIKDNRTDSADFASKLTNEQIEGINRGLNDLEQGIFVSHQEVKAKYGI